MSTTSSLYDDADDFILLLKLRITPGTPEDLSHIIDAVKSSLLDGETLTDYTFDGNW